MITIRCTEKQKEKLTNMFLGLTEVQRKSIFMCFDERECDECLKRHIHWIIDPEPLKNCPFCGGSKVDLWRCGNDFYIQCDDCGVKTKEVDNENAAVELWNRRN